MKPNQIQKAFEEVLGYIDPRIVWSNTQQEYIGESATIDQNLVNVMNEKYRLFKAGFQADRWIKIEDIPEVDEKEYWCCNAKGERMIKEAKNEKP